MFNVKKTNTPTPQQTNTQTNKQTNKQNKQNKRQKTKQNKTTTATTTTKQNKQTNKKMFIVSILPSFFSFLFFNTVFQGGGYSLREFEN